MMKAAGGKTVKKKDSKRTAKTATPAAKATQRSAMHATKAAKLARAASHNGKNKDRDVGGMAESALDIICRDIKANAQKSRHDEIGIDYLITLPSQNGAMATLRQQVPELSFVVQVKGSDDDIPSASLRLITWLRLISNPLPVFVLLVHFGGCTWPTKAFLMPLDKERASEALKTIHALDPPNERALNRRSLQISARQGEEISLTGKSFRDAVKGQIPDLRAAIQDKTGWLNTLGYEGPRVTLTIETPREATQDLIEFALGMRNEFHAVVKRMEEVRFSISRKRPSPGLVRFTSPAVPPVTTARLRFLSPTGRPAEFNCDVYHPAALFPFLQGERYPIRFKGVLVEFFLDNTTLQMTHSIDFHSCFSRRATLDEWLTFFRFLRLVTQHKPSLQLEIGGQVEKIEIQCNAPPLPPEVADLGTTVGYVESIARSFGNNLNKPFSLRMIVEDSEKIRTLYAIAVGSPDLPLGVQVPASRAWLDEQAKSGKRYGHIIIAAAQISDEFFLVAAVIHGHFSDTGVAAGDGMVWGALSPPNVEIVERHSEHVVGAKDLSLKPWYRLATQRAAQLGIELINPPEDKEGA